VTSIVIATARDAARLRRCLDAVARNTREEHEVVLVLNAADDDVVALARTAPATVVETPHNVGFAGAVNHGRRHATGDPIVLLHDDAEVEPGWLSALLDALGRHPDTGIVGPLGRTLLPDGRPGPPAGEVVDYCGSYCLAVRAATWDAIGGADERFFPGGYVDADLAVAAKQAGWGVRAEPGAVVHHRGGTMAPGFKRWVHERNRLLFLEKWSGANRTPRRHGPNAELELLREYTAERDAELAHLRAELERHAVAVRELHWHVADRDGEIAGLRGQLFVSGEP
jgi:GT2 family glycosyltransferase